MFSNLGKLNKKKKKDASGHSAQICRKFSAPSIQAKNMPRPTPRLSMVRTTSSTVGKSRSRRVATTTLLIASNAVMSGPLLEAVSLDDGERGWPNCIEGKRRGCQDASLEFRFRKVLISGSEGCTRPRLVAAQSIRIFLRKPRAQTSALQHAMPQGFWYLQFKQQADCK